MDMEGIKERVGYYKELLRLFWLTVVTIGGGLAGIIASPSALDKGNILFLAVVGVVLIITFIVGISKLHRDITALIKKLEQEG
ncbi:hypothetical protein [Hydrogenivirga sp. 128-5-R1-1]|uniref:hypothetical protein n=1 Tax=Hydrogenivirga sp. 128-5-R1-1 TaxID=392423 RepID=UPI00015F3973|nr:hypothetical protein [Hydrogenivirga sp. 128-5-R1-1]EDP75080.1 hypothetical protein HG1285_14469 [Hydrogenivirga sp. 128-5-R1-1]